MLPIPRLAKQFATLLVVRAVSACSIRPHETAIDRPGKQDFLKNSALHGYDNHGFGGYACLDEPLSARNRYRPQPYYLSGFVGETPSVLVDVILANPPFGTRPSGSVDVNREDLCHDEE